MKKFLAILLCVCMMASLCVIGAGAEGTASASVPSPTYSGGSGTQADPYKISTQADLETLRSVVNNGNACAGVYFGMTADITLSGNWTPIGEGYFNAGNSTPHPFSGHFNGNGKTISGLKVVPSPADDIAGNAATTINQKVDGTNEYSHNANTTVLAQGLFSYVSSATIKNLTIASPDVTGWNFAGALAGIAENSTISGITVKNPTIFCHWENAGGVLGTVRDTAGGTSTVSGCTVSGGTVSTPQQEENQNGAGGLIGRIQNGTNTISDNTVSGTSVTAYRKVAGLVGYVLQPTTCTMSGNVVSNVALSINSAAKNKLDNPTPYYGILFGEVQGSPNTNRAYETYTDNDYATGWSGTAQSNTLNIESGKTTLVNNTASGATVSMAQGVSEYVASVVGGNSYGYINSAIQAANSGDTVKVLTNFTTAKTIYVNKPLTLDLNGKTITSSASQVIRADAALIINATGGGTVNATASSYPLILVETAGITINGGTFNATNSAYALFIGNGTTAIVNDGTFNGWIYSNGSYTGVHVTFNGGTFNKMLYLAAKDISVTYNGGTFNAGTEFKGSTVTVNDGTFKGNDKEPTHTASGNGSSTNGAWALAVVDNAGYGAAKVTINGGKFTGMVEKLDDDSDASNNDDTLTISGGYFTVDPTAYVVEGKAAKTTAEPGYSFTVGDAVTVPAASAVATPEVANPGNVDNTIVTAVQNTEVVGNTLTDEAAAKAKTNTVSADVGAADLNNALGINTATKDNTKIVVQTYLDINIKSADTASKTITVDITPMYRTVATLENTENENIATTGSNKNAVVVGQPKELEITDPVTIKMAIPASMTTEDHTSSTGYAPLTIKHVKENGDIYYYEATVTAEDGGKYYATFTVTHGFSQFTLQAQDTRQLTVNYDSGASAKYSATDAGTALPAAAKSGYAFSGWTFTGATGTYTELTGALWDTLMTGQPGDRSVNATANFSAIPVGTASTTYTVTVSAAENGTVTADKTSAVKGALVTLTAAPSEEYKLDSVTVTDASGNAITTASTGDNTATFTMPAADVTVSASFKLNCPSAKFTDVDRTQWYHHAIDYVVTKALFSGTSDTTFEPETAMSRGMVVTVLYSLAGSPAVTGDSGFTDLTEDWYKNAVTWASSNKIVSGYGGGLFGPNDPITREQMAVILYSYAQFKGCDVSASAELTSFSDASDVSEYAVTAMQWAVGAKLIEGSDGKLLPQGEALRAQVAAMLMSFRENIVK